MIGLVSGALAALQAVSSDPVTLVPLRDGWAIAQTVSLVVLALSGVAIFALLLRVSLELRSLEGDVRRLVEGVEDRIDPVMERARSVAENVDFISRAVRTDVERLGKSVEGVRRRLDRASDRMEERIQEFNALMDVVQSEAEEIFLDTASTVRGVRAGTRSLGRRDRSGGTDGDDVPTGDRSGARDRSDAPGTGPLPDSGEE